MASLTPKQINVLRYRAKDCGLSYDETEKLVDIQFKDTLSIYEINELIGAIFELGKTIGVVTDPTVDAEQQRIIVRKMIALAYSSCSGCKKSGRFIGSFCTDCNQRIADETSYRSVETLKNSIE